jgi:hypothetical protein
MDFLIEEKTFELSIYECINMVESTSDQLNIYLSESFLDKSKAEDIKKEEMESSFKKFINKMLEIIGKILKSIKDFCNSARIKVAAHVQSFKLNKKLDELKDIMAKKKSKFLNKKYNYFDIKKYKAYYSDFINRYTQELKKGLNTDFKTVEDYEKWRLDMINKLSDFNYKLSDEEQWKLSISINSAIQLSDTEARNRDKNLKMVEEDGSRNIKSIENHYKKIDIENSMVNYNGKKYQLFRLKNSFIGVICSKIAQCIKTVVKFITKHTFACITGLIVVLLATK